MPNPCRGGRRAGPWLARACCSLALLAPLLAAWAAGDAAAPASLTQAVDSAWRLATGAAEAQAAAARAQARRAVADRVLPAPPSLELSHRRGKDGTSRETELGAAIPLWLPGQRGAQREAAEADVASAQAQAAYTRWQLAGEVREAGWAVLAAQAEEAQGQAHRASLQALARDVARRIQAGDLSRADGLAAQADALQAEAQWRDAALRTAEAKRRWALLTGSAAIAAASLDEPPAPPGAAPDPHPALQAALRTLEHARRQADAVRALRADPPELRVGARQDDEGSGRRHSALIGIRVPFGTEARNRPREVEASTAVDVAERQLQATRARLEADLAQAREALQVAQQRAEAEQARSALLAERERLVRKAFEAGEMDLPDLLRTLAGAAAAGADLERARAAWGLARARLAQAQGVTP